VLIVQKYGGTSVGTPERILKVADRVAERHAAGDRIIAVVSAMGQSTDHLLSLAHRITSRPSRREMDMLLTAGERISMALLSMALEARRIPAISFTGSQSGIITDTAHTRARILEIRPIRIVPELELGKVVIVAGFQGVSRDKEVTTLGRGGSDTTAIALAVGLDADLCEIYTDVPGVMTADPRHVPRARLLPRVSWDTMLELAASGAGVMHTRAVELARRRAVPFRVRSTFRKKEGTLVEGKPIEQGAGIAAVTGRPRAIYLSVPNPAGRERARLFAIAEARLKNAATVCALSLDGGGFSCVVSHDAEAVPAVEQMVSDLRGIGESPQVEDHLATVTLVGTGVLDLPGLSARVAGILAGAGIEPRALFTGSLALTVLVPEAAFGDAERLLHHAFLEQPAVRT
jgi:aspartate kinase